MNISFLEKIPYRKEVFLLTYGFILTGIIGAVITFGLQSASWRYQNNSAKLEKELNVASDVFEQISTVTDKRIYRMDKLDRWLVDGTDDVMINNLMWEYRDVLYEWNDSYNKNKALVNLYFGTEVSTRFDYIHFFFKQVGNDLETQYYLSSENRNQEQLVQIGNRIGDLNNIALEINEGMIKKIQAQSVGSFQK
ncbi:MAG: hypothetical protein WBP40_01005 [Candidatus Moraniibacteriota bacterium]